MKKLYVIVIILSLLLGSTTIVSAANGSKDVTVALSETPASVKVGETVNLRAVSEKHGSSFNVCWNNAAEGITVLDEETGNYVSEAVFKAEKPGIYTISYEITMYAGKSETEFTGRIERTIKVSGTLALVGANLSNITVTPAFRTDGSISVYKASGNIITLWSDGTEVSGSIFFNFGINETSKNVTAIIYNNGIKYTWTFYNVNRPQV